MIKDFIAIDFETANDSRISAVSIGVVPVCNGKIKHNQCLHYYICPPENYFKKIHFETHRITWEDVKDAPNFKELWDSSLKDLLDNKLIVCHNASIDKACLEQLLSYYDLNGKFHFLDTQLIAKRYFSFENNKLETICEYYSIPLDNHHNALCDAKACAAIALEMLQKIGTEGHQLIQASFIKHSQSNQEKLIKLKETHQKIKGDTLIPDFENVENKENPFYMKKVVISGTYENWPDRNDLAKIIKSMGADIDTSVTGKTNILIAGSGVGPKKLEKMRDNICAGKDAVIYNEKDILDILLTSLDAQLTTDNENEFNLKNPTHKPNMLTKEQTHSINIYNGANVFIDGNFSEYFKDKKQVKSILQNLGAKIVANIWNNVNIAIIGSRVRNETFETIFELQETGHDIEIMYEFELYYNLQEQGIPLKENPFYHDNEDLQVDIASGYPMFYILCIKAQAENAIQRETNGSYEAAIPLYKKLAKFNYKPRQILHQLTKYYHISRQYDKEIETIDLLISSLDPANEYYQDNIERYEKMKTKAIRFNS